MPTDELNLEKEDKKEFSAIRLGVTLFIIFIIAIGLFAIMWYFTHQGADDKTVVHDNLKVQIGGGITAINEGGEEKQNAEFTYNTKSIKKSDGTVDFNIEIKNEGHREVYLSSASKADVKKVEFFTDGTNLAFVWIPDENETDIPDFDKVSVGNIPHRTLADSEYTASGVVCPAMINDAFPIFTFDNEDSVSLRVVLTPGEKEINSSSIVLRFVAVDKNDCPQTLVGEDKIGTASANEKIVYYNKANKFLCYYSAEDYNSESAPSANGLIYSSDGKTWNSYGENNDTLKGEVFVRIAETADTKQSNTLKVQTDTEG